MADEVFHADPEHSGVIGQMLHDFNAEFGAPGPGAEEFAHRFSHLLTRDDVIVLLSGRVDRPTGLAFLTLRPSPYFDGPLAQLEELYVVPELRDHGIGTALLRAAVATVRERNAGELHINVDEVDVDTRRFYERHGFTNIEPGQDHRMLFYIREL
ncbi:GNAT family N-acetyltransferase [Brevibacterium daeguense]|uniref:GNAT family N-acetyltransferase n=1 Tax=Brevibacterium daeguense TaxID=909936 RepID=A0ABP8EJH4_9MICO|nr:GNAT family N-acetyltransferase [Brevibacterium daeguense]